MDDEADDGWKADRDQTEDLSGYCSICCLIRSPIAERLKARPDLIADSIPEIIADSFTEVTVLFADIVEFTHFSAHMSPEQLVAILNEIFTEFDNIADHRGIEKIKTIGDSYMAAAGLPDPVADHAVRAARMALDMLDALARFNLRHGYRLQMRIGLNSGPVVAGVIGRRKFIYDLWGPAVITASRMESHGVAGRVQVGDATRCLLGDIFLFDDRGAIDVKGIVVGFEAVDVDEQQREHGARALRAAPFAVQYFPETATIVQAGEPVGACQEHQLGFGAHAAAQLPAEDHGQRDERGAGRGNQRADCHGAVPPGRINVLLGFRDHDDQRQLGQMLEVVAAAYAVD